MAACSQINTPILNQQVDPCNGTHTSTNCIFFPNAITYLFIEPNEDLTAVIQAMVVSLQSNNTRINQLEEENAVQADLITNLQLDLEDLQNSVLDLGEIAGINNADYVRNTDDVHTATPKITQIVTLDAAQYAAATKLNSTLYIII